MRLLLILKQGSREIMRLIHPNAVLPIKVGQRAVPDRVMEAVWGFFSVYVLTFTIMFLAVLATGLGSDYVFFSGSRLYQQLRTGLGGSRPPLRRQSIQSPSGSSALLC